MLYLLLLLISCLYSIYGRPANKNHNKGTNDRNLDKSTSDTTYIPNSCVNHEDDDNVLIKLLPDDSYPVLNVKCRNEYMIVDLHKDILWEKYLVSTRDYHYNLVGPEKDDHVNWQEWIIPDMQDFLVSPDCNSCEEDFELNHKYLTSSGTLI